MKQWYPTMGAVVGGGVGSLAGPTGSALGAGGGALVGEVAKGNAEIEEARQKPYLHLLMEMWRPL